ncbi:hypothetical protein [Enterococcus sp. DIV0187]|uniref:hypothetical protein n=1 Tax=Enterococcus sp. DIV0187 TaxID=2774644 RepID=UPI003F20BC21
MENTTANTKTNIIDYSEITESIDIHSIVSIRKALGFDTIVLFRIVWVDRWSNVQEESHFRGFKKREDHAAAVEAELKELNKYKRSNFWKATVVELDVDGFEKVFNEASTTELKMIKNKLMRRLGTVNFYNTVAHINRKFW